MRKRTLNRRPSVSVYVIASLVVGLAFLGVTLLLWQNASQTLQQQFRTSAQQMSDNSTDAITKRLATYEEIMRGGAGLFKASEDVTRHEWKEFIDTYDVENRYPGAQGFGYAPYIKPADLAAHEAQIQAEGLPSYTVFPAGERPIYTPIVYLEPSTGSNPKVLGFDMSSESTRRAALFLARDTGQTSMSGKVILAQDTGQKTHEAGFLMFFPVYRNDTPISTPAERSAALMGFSYAPFRVSNLLNGIFGDKNDPNVGLKIYDGAGRNENAVMFESSDFKTLDAHPPIAITTQRQINHHTWTFVYAVSPNIISARDRQRPLATLISGLVFTVILTAFLFQLLVSRARSLAYSKQQEVQEAKDELLSLASHQLRTPATGVKQYLGMLLEGYAGKLSPEQNNMLSKAYTSNERQLEIINQILYVARADSGRILLHKQEVDLNSLVVQVINEQTGTIKSRKQKITCKKSRGKLIIMADKQYLHMAIDNLINNASKYTHSGGRIIVALKKVKGEAMISIQDTGVGINPQDAAQIFEKFTRLDNELSTQVGGSGIGLYLCQQIVELHGGRIILESKIGKGSIFTIYLPIE